MAVSRSQILDRLRDLFARCAVEFSDTGCTVIHACADEVNWSVSNGPFFGSIQETVLYSRESATYRSHAFFRLPSAVFNFLSPLYSTQWAQQQRDKAEFFTLDAMQAFNVQARQAGAWLKSEPNAHNSDIPADANADHYWLWSILNYGLSGTREPAQRLKKLFWICPDPDNLPPSLQKFDSAHFALRCKEIDYPETPQLLEEARKQLRGDPIYYDLADVLPMTLPESFFCRIPDVFQASLDLLDALASTDGFTSPSPNEDEPVEPDGFRFKGVVKRGLEPRPFRMLTFLWEQRNRVAAISDVAEFVFGDPEHQYEDEPHTWTTRLNSFFRTAGFPFHASIKNQQAVILDGAPRPSTKSPKAKTKKPKSRR